ncbi:kinesin, putative [Theileria equi strain WA]|uniref:Kinesin-like protein n=1 Tax=Theileria equi strain WA TaxID=1537102 RepID=L0AXL7_THEEQ|nr:kinesin, putative [Theileria equi strain WA]AFZ79654.1 kinesin, putative [Theileria equi strain WA]|eukprot:XP_004829320.1 kinesin, putative [Theileria equi strain WA]
MTKRLYDKGRIDVIVRKRPLNESEVSRGDRDIVSCRGRHVVVDEFKYRIDGTGYVEKHEFRVDRFYDETADNGLIYTEYVKPLIEYAFKEHKTCSCFTYGQTSSGKTYTMIGSRMHKAVNHKPIPGIYEYAANDIYDTLNKAEYNGKIEIMISFYEIYCGKLYDLLQNRKLLEALDNGKREVVIKDLTVRRITCREDLIEHMLDGLNLRRIGQNSQNDQSSRSHALLRIELKNIKTSKIQGRLMFIDLAGSERGADSINQCRQTQIDGAGINRSLLALKECIRAMDMEKLHIPFRNSELTKVLRDIFIGDSRNVMIANVCPSNLSCEQTLNTLRYASKVKSFKNCNSEIFKLSERGGKISNYESFQNSLSCPDETFSNSKSVENMVIDDDKSVISTNFSTNQLTRDSIDQLRNNSTDQDMNYMGNVESIDNSLITTPNESAGFSCVASRIPINTGLFCNMYRDVQMSSVSQSPMGDGTKTNTDFPTTLKLRTEHKDSSKMSPYAPRLVSCNTESNNETMDMHNGHDTSPRTRLVEDGLEKRFGLLDNSFSAEDTYANPCSNMYGTEISRNTSLNTAISVDFREGDSKTPTGRANQFNIPAENIDFETHGSYPNHPDSRIHDIELMLKSQNTLAMRSIQKAVKAMPLDSSKTTILQSLLEIHDMDYSCVYTTLTGKSISSVTREDIKYIAELQGNIHKSLIQCNEIHNKLSLLTLNGEYSDESYISNKVEMQLKSLLLLKQAHERYTQTSKLLAYVKSLCEEYS